MRRMRHLKPRELQSCDLAFQFWRPETLFDATSGGSPVASGGAIARAEDVSGNGAHATQSTSGARPTRQAAARNGLDVARFDGTNDVLSAGDAGDMLGNPLEYYAVFIRTGPAGLKGIFGKSVYGTAAGRWAILNDGVESGLFAGSGGSGAQANIATSTALQSFYVHHPRGNASLSAVRNASTTATTSASDDGTSYNTTAEVLIGAYQDAAGLPSFPDSFFGADMIECAKFSRNLGTHVRLRTQHAAMRRARIAS